MPPNFERTEAEFELRTLDRDQFLHQEAGPTRRKVNTHVPDAGWKGLLEPWRLWPRAGLKGWGPVKKRGLFSPDKKITTQLGGGSFPVPPAEGRGLGRWKRTWTTG